MKSTRQVRTYQDPARRCVVCCVADSLEMAGRWGLNPGYWRASGSGLSSPPAPHRLNPLGDPAISGCDWAARNLSDIMPRDKTSV
jgi:hypothetical protein